MARLLQLLFSLFVLAAPAAAQRRTVMEGLAASNNAVFISTPTGSIYVATAGTMTVGGNAFSVGASTLVAGGGKVGIGTASPGSKLDVSSDTIINSGQVYNAATGGKVPLIVRGAAGTGRATIQLDSYNGSYGPRAIFTDQTSYNYGFGMSDDATGALIWNSGNSSINNGTERMRITQSGNVGIGLDGPASKLNVRGATSGGKAVLTISPYPDVNGGGRIVFTDEVAYNFAVGMSSGDSPGAFVFNSGGSTAGTGTERMRVTATGLVGIATASPCSTCTLHIAGNLSVTGNIDAGSISGASPHILVASATVTGVTAATFTVTSSAGKVYYAVWKATQNTATADFGITFNGDTAANYNYHGRCENTGGASAVPVGTAGTQVYFDEQTSTRLTATSVFKGHAWIYMGDGTDFPAVYGINNIRLANTVGVSCANGGSWRSTASVTTIELRVNAGTFTGKVFLYSGEAYP